MYRRFFGSDQRKVGSGGSETVRSVRQDQRGQRGSGGSERVRQDQRGLYIFPNFGFSGRFVKKS